MNYTVKAVGDPQFPGFVIQDDEGRFYAEGIRGGFTSAERESTHFATRHSADDMVRQLREMEFLDRPIREFQIKATIRVSGNPEFNKADLLDFLKRSLAVSVDGDGPVPDSFLTITPEWNSLKRTKLWLAD